jgi:hypothetical protein
MTTQPQDGGRRPIDRVLSPGYADHVAGLSVDDLRGRRHEAEQEEVDLSYARRLLQGRLDLLRAEQVRRAGDGSHSDTAPAQQGARSDAELAKDLVAALVGDEGPRQDHGLGRHLDIEPSRVGEHRRAAELAVSDPRVSDAGHLDDEGLAEAIERMASLEQQVSINRQRVQQVTDALTEEVARRYRDGEITVQSALPEA